MNAYNILPSNVKKILVIDDEEICLMTVSVYLANSNYKLIKVKNVESGLNYLSSNNVDLIITDLMMPDMSGLDLLQILKSNVKFQNIPVILQTASSDIREILKAKALGAIKCLRKPYNKIQLSSIIDIIFKNENFL